MEPLESDTMPDAPALVVLTVMLAVVPHQFCRADFKFGWKVEADHMTCWL